MDNLKMMKKTIFGLQKNKKECDDGYIIDDYDSQRDLTTDEEIQNAAYYDLVNNDDTPIHNFKIWFPGCGIFTASKELGDPSVKNTDFVRITNSMRGEGDQGKVDSSIRFGITDALNLAYDLKKPPKSMVLLNLCMFLTKLIM